MNIFMNLIVSIILSIINLYLVELYIKYNIKDSCIVSKNSSFSKSIYIISLVLMFITYYATNNLFSKIVLNALSAFLIIQIYTKFFIKHICVFLLIEVLTNILTNLFFSWLFNIPLFSIEFQYSLLYKILILFTQKYIIYILISQYSNTIINNFTFVKIISFTLYIYFGITVLINNKSLFYFPSIGRTFVFVIILSIASLIFFDRYQTKHELIEREQAITTQNIIKEKEYLNKYNDSVDEIRKMRHDMHNNLHIIHGYLENEDITQANEYVCSLLGIMNKSSSLVHVGITSIDSIIDDKLKMMDHRGIQYNENITNVYLGNIDINDIAIVIGLALDNAIEAAEQVDANKYIELEMKNNKDYLIVHITNSIIPGSNPSFHKTSKLINPMNHGFGVKEIKHIVKQYNGEAIYEVNYDHVKLKIILNSLKKDSFEK